MERVGWNLLALLSGASEDYRSDVTLQHLRASVVCRNRSTGMFTTETRSTQRLYGGR
jgi:hypothetical protein